MKEKQFKSFETPFNEEVQWLFKEGKEYRIYKKLGAHYIDDENYIRFAVWAPHAKSVSVIGAFNNWDGRVHPLTLIDSVGIWEIVLPNIPIGSYYKYEIKTKEDILLYKADPYAQFCELRPGTASRTWLSHYEWGDKEWLTNRKKYHIKEEPVSIYEIHLGSWKKHYDGRLYNYREIADYLIPYIKEMGYTHIELMGILEYPFDGSWGYQVTGYFAPTCRYGTPDDFKYLIDQCHQHKIGVFLDWVPAHFATDAFSLEKFDGQALYEQESASFEKHPEWGTYLFNYGKHEVRLFLIASVLAWLEEYHLDGIRVDAVASMLYLDYGREGDINLRNKFGGRENLEAVAFIKELNEVVGKTFKDVIVIAEESTTWKGVTDDLAEETGLGFHFKWNMGWMNDILSYMKNDPIYRQYKHNKLTFSMMYAYDEYFILPLSHDEVVHGKATMAYKMPGDEWQRMANLRVLYGYMFMHPGKKLLFMGNEWGQTREWSEERELDWYLLQYPPHQGMQNYVKDLNHFYCQNPALFEKDYDRSGFKWLDVDNKEESVIAFVREGKQKEDTLIVVVNFTPEVRYQYKVGVDKMGEYEEVFNSDEMKYYGSGVLNKPIQSVEDLDGEEIYIKITVPPLGISIFKCIE